MGERKVKKGWNRNSRGVVYYRDGEGGIAYLEGSMNARVEAEADLDKMIKFFEKLAENDQTMVVADASRGR